MNCMWYQAVMVASGVWTVARMRVWGGQLMPPESATNVKWTNYREADIEASQLNMRGC